MTRFLTLALAFHSAVHADAITPVQRFFGMGGQFPDYSNESETAASPYDQAPFSPADSDLGVQEILTPYSGKSPILLNFATAIYRTDNAPTGINTVGDSSWIWSNRLSASWRPRLIYGWFGDFGIGQELLRFDRSSALDYENFNIRLGASKTIPELDDLVFYSRYEYQRITTGSLSDGEYNAHRLRAGIQKTLWATPRHQLTAGANIAYELSALPDTLERNEYTLELAHRYAITDNLYTFATIQASHYDYDSNGRSDWYYGASLQLIWQFATDATAHLSLFYDQNNSDSPLGANDYESFTGGIGAGFTFRF
jgi:hypothetical protein